MTLQTVTCLPSLRPYNIEVIIELNSDICYIERVRAGDTAAFVCLLDKYSRQVYSLIFRIVRNKEDAEELTQDVFMKVFKKLDGFKNDSSFSTWIYKIAYNTAISETRKKKYEFLTIEEERISNISEEEVVKIMDMKDKEEQINCLEAALNCLPPEEKAIILFFYMEEKSINDIAIITGLSVSNVKTRLHRIRKKLFILLNEMENLEK